MYTNDERFAILHTPGSNTWTLQIKFVQRRDHGMYECQVSNFPNLLNICVALAVAEVKLLHGKSRSIVGIILLLNARNQAKSFCKFECARIKPNSG